MIIRTPGRERYVIISKIPLEDSRLSWKARGLLSYLLSKPDNWTVIVKYLISQAPDGRASVMAGLHELREAGYLLSSKKRTEDGNFDGTDWEIFEEPTVSRLSDCGFSACGESAPNEELLIENTEVKSCAKKSHDYTPEFEAWWKIYPKPVDKRKTFGCWNATLRDRGGTVESLMLATPVFANQMLKEGREKQHILNSTTFLGPGERWREYLPATIDPEVLVMAKMWDDYDFSGGEEPIPFDPRPTDTNGNLLDSAGRAYYIDPMDYKRRYVDDE